MRLAVLVARHEGRSLIVRGTFGTTRDVRTLGGDRAADGYDFPEERVVRLPRRLTRGRDFDLVVSAARFDDIIGIP